MADVISGVVVTEVVNQLVSISKKTYKCKDNARNLATMISDFQPTIQEIQDTDVELSAHRQAQLRMFSETLDKCSKLTEKILKSKRWNVFRQLYHAKEMEDLEKKISVFLKHIPLRILADINHCRVENALRLDRIDMGVDRLGTCIPEVGTNLESVNEQLSNFEVQFDQMDMKFDQSDKDG